MLPESGSTEELRVFQEFNASVEKGDFEIDCMRYGLESRVFTITTTLYFEVLPQALHMQLFPNMQALRLRATLATDEGLSRLALWSMNASSAGIFFFCAYVFISHHTHCCDLTFSLKRRARVSSYHCHPDTHKVSFFVDPCTIAARYSLIDTAVLVVPS